MHSDPPRDAPDSDRERAIHPDLVAAAARLRAAGLSPPAGGDVHMVREYINRVNAVTARASKPLADEAELCFPVNGRTVPCTLYWPERAERPPLMVYCHGGGFRHGILAGWDAPLRQLVRESGLAVLSIGYALAPEHRFPTAFDEVVAIARQVITDRKVAGRSVCGFALAGDSAGANLALGAAVALRDLGVRGVDRLLLLYGVYSKDLSSPSWRRLSGLAGHGLSVESMRLYWSSYLAKDEDDWRVQPLHADLRGLPPTRVTVGELDPLLDENRILAEKLSASAVDCSLNILPAIPHGFMRWNEVAPVVRRILQDEAAALRHAFELPPPAQAG